MKASGIAFVDSQAGLRACSTGKATGGTVGHWAEGAPKELERSIAGVFDYAIGEGTLRERYHHVRFVERERNEEWRTDFAATYMASTPRLDRFYREQQALLQEKVGIQVHQFLDCVVERAARVEHLLRHREVAVPAAVRALREEAERLARDPKVRSALTMDDPESGSIDDSRLHEVKVWAAEAAAKVLRVVAPAGQLPSSSPSEDAEDMDLAVPAPLPADSPFPSVAAWRNALLDAYSDIEYLQEARPGETIELQDLSTWSVDSSLVDDPSFFGEADDHADFRREQRLLEEQLQPFPRRKLPPSLEQDAPEDMQHMAIALEKNRSFTPQDRAHALQTYADLKMEADADVKRGSVDLDDERLWQRVEELEHGPKEFVDSYSRHQPWTAPRDIERADPSGLSVEELYRDDLGAAAERSRLVRSLDEVGRRVGDRPTPQEKDDDVLDYDAYAEFLMAVDPTERSEAAEAVRKAVKERTERNA